MFEINSKNIESEKDNFIVKKTINLDANLDCFILVSSDNANFWDLIINNILDFLIDKISKDNTYNDFSVALENINSFIKKWEIDADKKLNLDIIIWILNENNYIFSNIWKSSCYLINKNNEVIELTNKEEKKKEFSYVSSWELKNDEIIINSTFRLLNYLSQSDLIDWLVLSEDLELFNKNIANILENEIISENIAFNSIKYKSNKIEQNEDNKIDLIKQNFFKAIDNDFSKNVLRFILKIKDKINSSSKNIKNAIFLSWMIIWIIFLYYILSAVIWATTQNENKQIATDKIAEARNYIRIASENIANNEIFDLNIKTTKEILEELKEQNLFLDDVAKINDDINTLKKQFNKVEIFELTEQNTILNEQIKNPVKLLKSNLKTYAVTNKSVLWPIIPNTTPKNYIFSALEENENFIDAAFIWDNMYLLTSNSKIVKFSSNWYFSFMNVSWQEKWEDAKSISSFAQNIYLLWKNDNQINRHNLLWSDFKKADLYLKNEDLTQIWEILSITIDWSFYILKKDLSMIKFYSNPYRIEKLMLNKLPQNYTIEEENSWVNIKTRAELKYVYMLLNNKVWVFRPNTTNIQNTKSLQYIWQIESSKEKIKDFFINHDWEILILNEKWIYKINYEISDDRLLIR